MLPYAELQYGFRLHPVYRLRCFCKLNFPGTLFCGRGKGGKKCKCVLPHIGLC